MKRRTLAIALAFPLILLAGCSAADDTAPVSSDAAPADTADTVTDDTTNDSTGNSADAWAGITSCDQVAQAVAPYIENLVLTEGSTVDEWGVSCSWDMAEDETNWENNRSVKVGIAPPATEKPDLVQLAEFSDLIEPLEEEWVSAMGGVAYTSTMEIAVASAIVTTVWLPEVEATVTGGAWEAYPALDGPAAVGVVAALLN